MSDFRPNSYLENVFNVDLIRKRLNDLPVKLAKNILKRAVIKAAKELLKGVVDRAPVGTQQKYGRFQIKGSRKTGRRSKAGASGDLANSLKATFTRKVDKNQVGAKVATDKYYARFVEFGTVKMQAKPFMRPAFDAVESKLIDIIKKAIEQGLEKEVNS